MLENLSGLEWQALEALGQELLGSPDIDLLLRAIAQKQIALKKANPPCPYCGQGGTKKLGRPVRLQRYRCPACKRSFQLSTDIKKKRQLSDQAMRDLQAQGFSQRAIAQQAGISQQAVSAILTKAT